MLKVENVQVWGFEHAVRAARNPLSSWSKSDSGYIASGEHYENVDYVIGPNDLALMKKLAKAGVEHRTYARLIQVSMDITAPLYFWKEADRYCVGKSQISTSTMHTLTAKRFEMTDFSVDEMSDIGLQTLKDIIDALNDMREMYLETKRKAIWRDIVCILPESFNQKRTVLMSYEVCLKMIREREGHKLSEWHTFCDALKRLPYIKELIE